MTETKWRNDRSWPKADLNFNVFWGDRTSALEKSGLSDFLNVSDSTQAEFAKIPIARVFSWCHQKVILDSYS